MQEIGDLRFNRAIVPEDAANLQINTLDFGDAGQFMICTCVYARFKRSNGNHSCQLVLSRTKVVPQGMSQPRAELLAALTNSNTGEVVRRSFKNFHQSAIKFTDSQICLYWITNDQKPLKQWVRNRVIEIQRFTSQDQWFYIHSKNMIADLGTRRGVTLEEVNQHSTWINGFHWMQLDHAQFPMSSPTDIKLNESDEVKMEAEVHLADQVKVSTNVRGRYAFSDYLIDPNKDSFTKVVRIIACQSILSKPFKTSKKHLHFNSVTKSDRSRDCRCRMLLLQERNS